MIEAGRATHHSGCPDPHVTHQVTRGRHRVSSDPSDVFATLLGSCVAACLRDPVAGVGGMNHFLLPGGGDVDGLAARFGVHAMELLVNALLERGALRSRLEAKLFGGARTVPGLADIGALNARFATSFLRRERIRIASSCLGGALGRRVQFWPVSGRARRSFMRPTDRLPSSRPDALPTDWGTVELFDASALAMTARSRFQDRSPRPR